MSISKIYPVRMAEIRIARAPDILAVYGVGSCVIVVMYDKTTKLGGMAHVMLPHINLEEHTKENPRKFANTAVPLLFQTLQHAGADPKKIEAKIVGGAQMFPPVEGNENKIGERNALACEEALKKLDVPIVAKDLGGQTGRSIELDLDSGILYVTVLGDEKRKI